MPVLNNRKYSKSELILKLSNPETRDNTISIIESSNYYSLPQWIFKSIERKKSKKITLKYFSSLKDDDIVKILFSQSKSKIISLLRSGLRLSNDLKFESKEIQVFYQSILLFQEKLNSEIYKDLKHILNSEYDILLSLYNEFGKTKKIFKKLLIRFSKETLKTLMSNFGWNFQVIDEFLISLAPKLHPSAIQLWFENDYIISDKFFNKLDQMKLSEATPFNQNVFNSLMKYKIFRKALFNGIVSRNFLLSIKDYASRPDFNFFYAKNKINRNIICKIPPKDAIEFLFFSKKDNLKFSDLIKIDRYQTIIGHSPILNSWVNDHVEFLVSCISNSDYEQLLVRILTNVIKFNSYLIENSNDKIATDINNRLFDSLKSNESLFRSLIWYFYNPKDLILFKLITKDFSFSIENAIKLINQGFDEELIEYFKLQPIKSYIDLVDDWSLSFFLRLFSSDYLNNENVLPILNFLNHQISNIPINRKGTQKSIQLIYEVYSRICDFNSMNIFENLFKPLKFIYCLRHHNFIQNFISEIKPSECSLLSASQIYELSTYLSQNSIPVDRNATEYYQIAMSSDVLIDENDIVHSVFCYNFIVKKDSYYLLIHYFDTFLSQVFQKFTKEQIACFAESPHNFDHYLLEGSDINRLSSILKEEVEFDVEMKVSFIMQFNCSDKYTLYILFDKIIDVLISGSSTEKIFILSFIDSSLLSKNHILKFIDCLIPLLNSPNRVLCNLSKSKFKQIRVENQEIQNILPDIILTFENKSYFPSFYKAFENILFNNYLCFNSVNIIIQLLFKYLDSNTKECLNILSRIVNITKDRDIKHISGLIFTNISKFVVTNNFYTLEALSVASQFCVYAKFEDFHILLKHLHSLRICNYMVGILKVKGDSDLNNRIIQYVISNGSNLNEKSSIIENQHSNSSILNESIQKLDISNTVCQVESSCSIEPSFIAAVCELSEFNRYLGYFIPAIKNLFKSSKIESRQIACKAMKGILSNPSHDSFKKDLNDFLIDMCISTDHTIRLSALDVIHYLPLIYILRNDAHTLVKKKAYEIWKEHVSNSNKELKILYKDILSYLKYYDSPVFSLALKATLHEMAQKYIVYLEMYLDDSESSSKYKEYILIEAAQCSKLINRAVDYCSNNFCPELFKILFKNINIRDTVVENANPEMLLEICAENCDLALFMFNKLNNPIYIDYLSYSQKIDIIKGHYSNHRTLTLNDENIILILQTIESSFEIENILVKIHPSYSYYYISVNRVNYGLLNRIYERVFDICYNLDELVNERSILFIKNCSFEHINDKNNLLYLLIKNEDRKSFERAVEIIKTEDFILEKDQNSLFILLGYLFRNFLSKNRRVDSEDCIMKLYHQNIDGLGFFENIIRDVILNK